MNRDIREKIITFLCYLLVISLSLYDSIFIIDITGTVRWCYIIGALLFLFVIYKKFKKENLSLKKTRIDDFVWLYIIISFIFLIYGLFFIKIGEIGQGLRSSTWNPIFEWFLLIAFVIIFFYTPRFLIIKKQMWINIMKVWFFVVSFVALYAIVQFIFYQLGIENYLLPFPDATAGYSGIRFLRPPSTFTEPNNMSSFINLIFPLMISLVLHRTYSFFKVKNKIFYSMLILIIIATLLGMSRANLLGLLVALFIIFLLSKAKKVYLKSTLVLVIFFLLFLFIFPVLFHTISNRFFSGFDIMDTNRGSVLKNWYNIYSIHPILGVGYGNYPYFCAQYLNRTKGCSPHGIFQNMLGEMGVVGFFVFFALITSVYISMFDAFYKTKKNKVLNSISLGFIASFSAHMVYLLFSGSRISYFLWFFFAMFLCFKAMFIKKKIIYPIKKGNYH